MNNTKLKFGELKLVKTEDDFAQSFKFWESLFPELQDSSDSNLYELDETFHDTTLLNRFLESEEYEFYTNEHTYDSNYLIWVDEVMDSMDKDLLGWKNFYKFIVLSALEGYYTQICESKAILNAEVLFKQTIQQMIRHVFLMSYRVLIADTNAGRETGILSGETETDRAAYYKSVLLKDEGYVCRLCNRYPILVRRMLQKLNVISDYILEIINHYSEDCLLIAETFNQNTTLGKITKIDFGAGDTHKGGKTVSIVYCENGKIVYKPRCLKIDLNFNEFVNIINKQIPGDVLPIKTYAVIDCGTHGWTEFVCFKECLNEVEVKNYYVRIGELLAICYLFGATDLHAENIIANGEHPMIIDLETLFSGGFIEKSIIHESIGNYIGNQILNSVKGSAILPIKMRNKKFNKQVDLSGLSNAEAQLSPFKSYFVKNANSDHVEILRDFAYMESSDNIVTMNGEMMQAEHNLKEIIEGFEKIYYYFISDKELIVYLCETLFEGVEYRVILRDTMTYSQLLTSSYHPDLNQYTYDTYMFFERLFLNTDESYRCILKAEHADLMVDDVPFFTAKYDERDLVDSFGNRYEEFLKQSAKERVAEKIDAMGIGDLAVQKKLIYQSFYESNGNLLNTSFTYQSFNNKKLDRTKVLDCVVKLAEEIYKVSIPAKVGESIHRSWIGYVQVEQGLKQTSPVGLGVYDGNVGIAILYSSLYRITKNEKYRQISLEILAPVVSYLQTFEVERDGRNGFYSGFMGTIAILLENAILLEDETLKEEVHLVLNRVLNESCNTEYQDIIAGNAGALLSVLKISKHIGNFKALDNYKNVVIDKLLRGCKVNDKNCQLDLNGYTGYAHGTAGVSHLLYATSKTNIETYVEGMLHYERSLYNYDLGNYAKSNTDSTCHMKWCHGLPGILLNRISLLKLGYKDERILREITNGVDKVKEGAFGHNSCLCHGDLGNLMILFEAAKLQKDNGFMDEVKMQVDQIAETMTKRLMEEHFTNSVGVGLMTGLSGVGYAMLYMAFDEYELPNVLGI